MNKEILNIRNDFPVLRNNPNVVYLDSAATSLKPDCVINKINEYYTQYGVNVNRGVYKLSYTATEEYEETRQIVKEFLNAKEIEEIVYTKGASNGLNMLALSLRETLKEGDEVVSTILEHHSSILPWQENCKIKKAKLVYTEIDKDGSVDLESFKKVINEKTKYVVVTYVSNVMGQILPIKEIVHIAHQYNALVIVDAAQAVPHLKVDVQDLDCDFLCFSAHKMLGPTGFGILYGKKKYLNKLKPLEYGGDMIDEVELYDNTTKDTPYKFETGTPPISEAIAFKEAIKYLNNIGFEKIEKHVEELTKYTLDKLDNLEGLTIYNKKSALKSGIITFNIRGVHPHDVSTIFDERDICLRAGHHCAQLITKHLGVVGTLRASIYIYNTYEDMDKFIDAVKVACDYFKDW